MAGNERLNQIEALKSVNKIQPLLCAAVGTASH